VKIIRKTKKRNSLKRNCSGDVVNLSEGDKVPADLRLIEASEIE
jgi:magnesium-transporting ATPase (P-type)